MQRAARMQPLALATLLKPASAPGACRQPCARACGQCIFPAAMSHPLTALSKTALDQLVMAPAGIALFFTAMGLLEGQGVQQSLDGMRAKLRPTLLANYALWPAANMVNFAFVPPQQRILYCNVVYVSVAAVARATQAAARAGLGLHARALAAAAALGRACRGC